MLWRHSIGQCSSGCVKRFANALDKFLKRDLREGYYLATKDFLLPGFRVLALKDAIGASPMQYFMTAREHAKGREFRTSYVLSALGIRTDELGRKCYSLMTKDERHKVRQVFGQF